MNQSIDCALFWIWDSLRNSQLWVQTQPAVSPVSRQMLECFPGLSLPCESCWSRAVLSWLWAGSASLLQVSPAWQCCHSVTRWLQRCGSSNPSSGELCLVLLGPAGLPLQQQSQTELHWWLCPSFPCRFLFPGEKLGIVPALPQPWLAEVTSSKSCCRQNSV